MLLESYNSVGYKKFVDVQNKINAGLGQNIAVIALCKNPLGRSNKVLEVF